MRYAILSDIHGNAPALRLALEDALRAGAEGFLFAGDYCIGSPWGREVADLLRFCPNARIVCGNEEAHFQPGNPLLQGDNGQYEVTRWTDRQLDEAQRRFLLSLPARIDWENGGFSLCMSHRHKDLFPQGVMERYLATSQVAARFPQNVPHEVYLQDTQARVQRDAALHRALPGMPDILIFGHTHGQWHAWVDGHLLLNPGSCGEPLDCGGFAACYTLLDVNDGQVSVTERRLSMDVDALIAQAKATEQYTCARVWSELVFVAWQDGRESIAAFLRFAFDYADQIGDPVRPLSPNTWNQAYNVWSNRRNQP